MTMTQMAGKERKKTGILPRCVCRWNAECKHSVNQKQQLKRISEKFPEYFLFFHSEMQVVQSIWK